MRGGQFPRRWHMNTKPPCDVIVVGSGASGCWAAKELTEGGCRVLLLEAGRDLDGDGEFSRTPKPLSVTDRLMAARDGQPVQARCPAFTHHVAHFYVDDRENPYSTPAGMPFLWIRGRQIGGRLHTWARASLRMSPSELDRRCPDRFGSDMRWPLGYDDLATYYDRVEKTLGVQGNQDGIPNVPDGEFRPPVPLAPSNREFAARLYSASGLTLIQNRLSSMSEYRIPTPLLLAHRTGKLRIRTDSVVRHVLIDRDTGRAEGIGYHDRLTGTYYEVRAKIVILCTSAFESVRILLNSANPHHPEGVGGSSGVLGRYVCDHVLFGRDGFAAGEYADLNRREGFDPRIPSRDPLDFGGYHSMYLPDFTTRWGPEVDFPGGYGIQCGVVPPIWWALAFGEMTPRWENRISLSPTKKDAWGIPAAHIEIRHGPDEVRMIRHIASAIDEIAAIAGVTAANPPLAAQGGQLDSFLFRLLRRKVLGRHGAFHPGAAIHETGGARMGTDPKNSVLNRFCQCWDVPNLFVTDGACFVSTGFQNHTLTIMALTARACDYILRGYGREKGSAT